MGSGNGQAERLLGHDDHLRLLVRRGRCGIIGAQVEDPRLASGVTEQELRAGEFRRQDDCVDTARRLRYLPTTHACQDLKNRWLQERIVPVTKPLDALHMAIATAHRMDYLLTWNYAHLANPIAQRQLEAFCDANGLRAPLLVSPESIPSVRMGRIIRRRD